MKSSEPTWKNVLLTVAIIATVYLIPAVILGYSLDRIFVALVLIVIIGIPLMRFTLKRVRDSETKRYDSSQSSTSVHKDQES